MGTTMNATGETHNGVRLLLSLRWQLLRNRVRQAMREQPLRVAGAVASILLIWVALYVLLAETLQFVNRSPLEGVVATQYILTFFFLALTGMLAFSTAILCYGSLFKHAESAYLLATPLHLRDVVIVKYIECLVLASWSLLLLGFPLMLAMARMSNESWSFYPLFIGLFLLFIPVPGALGLLLSWAIVMVFPKSPKRTALGIVVVLALLATWWMWDVIATPVTSKAWLMRFYDRISLARSALLPSEWVAKGLDFARHGESDKAGFYLMVMLANALFASVVAINIVWPRLIQAFTRAQGSSGRRLTPSSRILGWVAEVLFVYLPGKQRLLAAKDLKSFFRDPLQWSQMAILFGLLTFYVLNVPRMWNDYSEPWLLLLIAFLNLTAVSLILATFTSRFVFPLVSLEGQQLWLLGLLALRRRRMVTGKFLYALTLTLVAAMAVMGVSAVRLELSQPLVITHLVSIASICVGLCGVSIGMGAKMPVFNERNPGRIAGGFGGTVSLLISVALVAVSLMPVGLMTLHESKVGFCDTFSPWMVAALVAVVLINAITAMITMTVGIRHFERSEW